MSRRGSGGGSAIRVGYIGGFNGASAFALAEQRDLWAKYGLEREPTLTPEDVQQRLRITARRDAGTGRVWNPRYGWGKLDAEELLDTYRPGP